MAVYRMCRVAKQRVCSDLETTTSLRVSLAWVTRAFAQTRTLMGADDWPYGIAANRNELELVMRYTHEQGLVQSTADFGEMFHPATPET